jgi:hypothetical protein
MDKDKTLKKTEMVQGTLYMLILKTLERNPGADARLRHCTVPPADH